MAAARPDAGTTCFREEARTTRTTNLPTPYASGSDPSRSDPLVDLACELMKAMELEVREHLAEYGRLREFVQHPEGPERQWVASFATAWRLSGWFSAFDH